MLNIITGERQNGNQETKSYVGGEYGKPPAEISEEIRKQLIGDEEPITCRLPIC